jgi:hypothetical protein
MSTNPPSFRLPINVRGLVPDQVAEAIETHDDAITDLQQAISPLATQITALKSGTSSSTGTGTTTVENVSTEQITNNFVNNIGFVNNQTGVTSYATQQSDLGKIVVLDDASAIAVALTSAPVITLPWYANFLNLGSGTATLTPVSGMISYAGHIGAGSMPIATGQFAFVYFDGTNFWAVLGISSGGGTVPNFADSEVVAGSGTAWTLAHTPVGGCVPLVVVMLPAFGGITLLLGQTPGFTISGSNITTTNSYSAGGVFAWYRY